MFVLNSHRFGTEPALEFVIPASSVAGNESNYLAYIDFSDSTIQASSTFLAALIAGGGNIQVYAEDKATEWHRHVNLVSANTSGQIWLQIPSLSSTADTTFYLKADKQMSADYAVTDTHGRNATFNQLQYFLGMDADPSTGLLADWTGNLGNWTIDNMVAGDQTTQTSGMGAYTFGGPGSNERVYKDGNFFSNATGAVTALIKVNSLLAANGVEVLWAYGGSGDTANPGFLTLQKRRNNSWFGDNDNHWGWVCRPEGEATPEIKGSASAITNGSTSLVSVVRRLNNDPDFYVNGVFQTLVNTQQRSRTYFDNVGVAAVGTPRLAVGNAYNDGGWGANESSDTIGPVFQEDNIPSANLQATRSNNYTDPATFYDSITEVTF